MQKGYTSKKHILVSLIAVILAFVSLTTTVFANTGFVPFDKANYANADPDKYSIELDLTNKVITIYEQDEKGKYSKIAKEFICTTGNDETPTPEGTFRLNDSRRRFGFFRKYNVYGQYWTHVVGGIYFHSILYTQKKEGSFTRTSYNALGKQASHGCIRMLVEDARWLYYNCPGGTTVKIVSKGKNEKLRKSLIPTTPANKYYPTVDQYENTKRGNPKALLTTDAYFTSTKNVTYKVDKGKDVEVVSSGKQTCRVRVDGVVGHIETKYLDFLPNGPKDQKAIATAIKAAKTHYEIKAEKTNVYEKASKNQKVIGIYGKGTEVKIVGETSSYHKVEVDGLTGYVDKADVVQLKGTISSKPKVVRYKLEVEKEVEAEVDETPNTEKVDDTTGEIETSDTNEFVDIEEL